MVRTTCNCRRNREVANTREKQRKSWLPRPEACDNMVAMVPHQQFLKPRLMEKCTTDSITARVVDSNRRHLEQGVLGGMAVGRRRLIMQSKCGEH